MHPKPITIIFWEYRNGRMKLPLCKTKHQGFPMRGVIVPSNKLPSVCNIYITLILLKDTNMITLFKYILCIMYNGLQHFICDIARVIIKIYHIFTLCCCKCVKVLRKCTLEYFCHCTISPILLH